MPQSRSAMYDEMMNEIKMGQGGSVKLRQRIETLRAGGLLPMSDIARLERALDADADDPVDLFDNVPL
ncbi:MAG: hypothetical protein GW905_09415 [Rhodobacterales bacterium]|nr:hypothetical protein [Rhodobacterales bacterium]